MTGTTHRLGGMLTGIILAGQLHAGALEGAFLVSGAVLGSLLPDIDNVHSTIGSLLPGISFLVKICQKLIRIISCCFPGKLGGNIRSLAGHRGLAHSLIPPAALAVAAFFERQGQAGIFLMGIAAGILSHLVLDMFSGGIPLMMPFSMKRFKLASVKTGGLIENVIDFALLAAITAYLCAYIFYNR